MLPLLSGPLRRWLLITLLVPAVAFILRKLGFFLQRRNEGQPTRLSRILLKSSSFLQRRVSKKSDAQALPEARRSS